MRNLFSWRLRPSEADFLKLWEDATFVFDTNFLLDLYRVSRSTAEDFLKILERIQNRIWLPYQVADEFLRNREEIIASEAASFQKALAGLERWKSEQQSFNGLRSYLSQAGRIVATEVEFLFNKQNDYLNVVNEVEKAFREKIDQLARDHSSLNSDEDSILDNLLSLFDSRVGEPFDEQNLSNLHREAEDRYKQLKPPGFKDKGKEDTRKYGDFILWKEILDFAKKESRPIIFITGDKKADWWIMRNGETISPHVDLRREFQEHVQQPFWMYRPQRFLEMAREKLMVEIAPKSIEETSAIADLEFTDEQDYKTLGGSIEQIKSSNHSSKTVPKSVSISNSDIGKALERVQSSYALQAAFDLELLQSLIGPIVDPEQMKRMQSLIGPIVDPEQMKRMQSLIRPIVDPEQMKRMQSLIRPIVDPEQMKRMQSLIGPIVDPEQMKRMQSLIRPIVDPE
jgi:predicted nucleic acid-binding protein